MRIKSSTTIAISIVLCVIIVVALGVAAGTGYNIAKKNVTVDVFAPQDKDISGVSNKAFIIDMEVTFNGFNLKQSGFTTPALTGPGQHTNVPPFPAPSSIGKNVKFPGLIVLLSGTSSQPPFNGSGTNLAGLFNIVTISNRQIINYNFPITELWTTWLVGADKFGSGNSKLLVAVAKDKNKDGIFNDAPNVIPDADHNGIVNEKDLIAFGVASKIVKVNFIINPNP